ncbi:MAG: signal peptidase II [Candidatus Bipolaricaulia bacterium]
MNWILPMIGTVAVDQLSKLIVVNNLTVYQSIPVIDGFFHITLIQNTGGAFGILQGRGEWMTVVTAVIVIGLLGFLLRLKKIGLKVPLAIILGGALGNLIDRIQFGYVVDFFDFRFWPVFNVADSAILIGAVWIAVQLIGERSESREAE